MTHNEIFIHIAHLIFLLAFLARDILWLRILIMHSCIAMIIYGYKTSQSAMMAWETAFLVINSVQVYLIFLERRDIKLPEMLEETYNRVFHAFTKKEFMKFWNTGEDIVVSETLLCKGGEVPSCLLLLTQGEAEVTREGQHVATLKELQFIGEMSFLTQSAASATVQADHGTLLHRWSDLQLKQMKKKWPIIHEKLLLTLGQDLIRKINQSTKYTPEHE